MSRSAVLCSLLLGLCSPALAEDGPVPVVVAAVDIPAGTRVTMEMLSQRSTPRAFVTSSSVKPDQVSYVINQRTLAPLLEGDALLWGFFQTTQGVDAVEACAKRMRQPPSARGQLARQRAAVLKKP